MKVVPCESCPLRTLPLFLPLADGELALIESLKRDQTMVRADASIIHEGQTNAPLYTLLSGWAFRFKTLSDGRRQILNFLLPGDFIGVQQKMADSSAHGVHAIESDRCTNSRDRVAAGTSERRLASCRTPPHRPADEAPLPGAPRPCLASQAVPTRRTRRSQRAPRRISRRLAMSATHRCARRSRERWHRRDAESARPQANGSAGRV